jgi:hypothetical protein
MLSLSETRGICAGSFGHSIVTIHTPSTTYSTYTRTVLCLNCFIKINQNNKELEDHENDPPFTPDTVITYVERARDASFSALDILCVKMNVLVKGKRLLWACESYYRHLLL